jgi:hypothetical protein
MSGEVIPLSSFYGLEGGCWFWYERYCRVRDLTEPKQEQSPDKCSSVLGFRLVRRCK